MRCPACRSVHDRVVESRLVDDGEAIRRRRECTVCLTRFSTFERVVETRLMVLKRNGEREPYDVEKIVAGLTAALKNRPVSEQEVRVLAESLTAHFKQGGDEVSSSTIGLALLAELRELDEVGYLRFASVYKNFTDVEDFRREAVAINFRLAKKDGQSA